MTRPAVVIVGRPNVGKSTLFNRLTRSRRAIVGNEPGITRDRQYGTAEWRGRQFTVIDTGGLMPHDRDLMATAIFSQAEQAIREAAVVVWVVDGRSDPLAADRQLAPLLRKTGKPLILAVNKRDTARQQEEPGSYFELGVTPAIAISAEHGSGITELLDAVSAHLPPETPEADAEAAADEPDAGGLRIAIIGRPNVGKSTLLNRLCGSERVIVSPVAGTTRDAVDALVERDGKRYRFIDTAGLRRKGKTRLMAEKLSVVMARKHLETADLALILVDGAEPEGGGVTALDATIAGYAIEAGRSAIVVVNKWDRAASLRRTRAGFERLIREHMKFLAFAPVAFVSATTGAGLARLYTLIDEVAAARRRRVPTAELNRFLAGLDLERAPAPASRAVKIYYLSQVATAPPQFVLFVDRPRALHFSTQRFLENQIRRAFNFEGTPIRIKTRVSGGRR